jgi:N-acetylmuramoyl-L-alanine amidase
VRDLQRRLGAAGFTPEGAEAGFFCARTIAALVRFQSQRGLRSTGVCDEDTWRALVEASWKLGDRMLMHVAPNLRGDDVAELQSLLGRLGFDSGRVDGIFGPGTVRALEDFQHNSGMYVDGVCGPDTIRALQVLARQTGSGPGISAVRELELLTASARKLADLRLVIGQFSGLSALTRQLVVALRQRSATVIASDEPDASAQAVAANRFAATAYLGFESQAAARPTIYFYSASQFESLGGRALATRLATACATSTDLVPEIHGMRLPILRETRMPAVLFNLGDAQPALDDSERIVVAAVAALETWALTPVPATEPGPGVAQSRVEP